jgi:hypothetical protein
VGKLARVTIPTLFDRTERVAPLALLIVVIAAGIGLLLLTNRYPTNPDSIGYIYAGLQLADGEGLGQYNALNRDVAPFFYLHSFRAVEAGSPRAWFGYPPGYAVLIALAVVVSGSSGAAFYVTALLPLVALVATYYLGRCGGQNRWTAVAASLILAASASLWRFGTEPWSELPSLVTLTIGGVAFLVSRDPQRAHQHRGWWAVVAGLMFGCPLLIRPTNLILVGPALFLTDLILIRPNARLPVLPLLRTGWSTYAVMGLFAAVTLTYNCHSSH